MSNALEAASLIMVPSGYENGTLASVKPNDGTGDFTFSRGSNLSATRINEQGYIEKGYENLLTYSNDFSQWTILNATATSGQSGYDGTNDATEISFTAGPARAIGKNGLVTGIVNFSVYLKAGTHNIIQFSTTNAATTYANFNTSASNPVTGNTGGLVVDSSIEDVGNEWYRCSAVLNNSGSGGMWIWVVDSLTSGRASSVSTDGTFFVQDAMLNQGLVAYPYIETTTAPVSGGILENMPRLDWASGAPSLLLEPSRTNLFAHSEYFDVFPWSFSTGAMNLVENNSIISPEGLKNATKIERTATRVYTSFYSALNATLGATYTLSVYMKAGTHDIGLLSFILFGSSGYTASYDLTNGATNSLEGDAISSMESVGDGWWRCVLSGFTPPDSDLSGRAQIGMSYTSAIANWSPQTGGAGLYMYYYGAQLEQDATYPTSYIPTYGVSQTRLKDSGVASNVASLIGQTEGTIFIDGASDFNENISRAMLHIDHSLNDRIEVNLRGDFISSSFRNTLGSFFFVNTPSRGDRFKFAVSYQSGNTKFYLNGSLIDTKTQSLLFGNPLSNVKLNDGISAGSATQSELNKVLLFPTALSDSECIELTTI